MILTAETLKCLPREACARSYSPESTWSQNNGSLPQKGRSPKICRASLLRRGSLGSEPKANTAHRPRPPVPFPFWFNGLPYKTNQERRAHLSRASNSEPCHLAILCGFPRGTSVPRPAFSVSLASRCCLWPALGSPRCGVWGLRR